MAWSSIYQITNRAVGKQVTDESMRKRGEQWQPLMVMWLFTLIKLWLTYSSAHTVPHNIIYLVADKELHRQKYECCFKEAFLCFSWIWIIYKHLQHGSNISVTSLVLNQMSNIVTSPLLLLRWSYICVLADNYDVTVRLTFEHLNRNCHDLIFIILKVICAKSQSDFRPKFLLSQVFQSVFSSFKKSCPWERWTFEMFLIFYIDYITEKPVGSWILYIYKLLK